MSDQNVLLDAALIWLAARDRAETALNEHTVAQGLLRQHADRLLSLVGEPTPVVIVTPNGNVRVADGGVFKEGVIWRV